MLIKTIKGKWFNLGDYIEKIARKIKVTAKPPHKIEKRPTVNKRRKIPWLDYYIVSGIELRDQVTAAAQAETAERDNVYKLEKTIALKTALVAGLLIRVNKLAKRLVRYEG